MSILSAAFRALPKNVPTAQAFDAQKIDCLPDPIQRLIAKRFLIQAHKKEVRMLEGQEKLREWERLLGICGT